MWLDVPFYLEVADAVVPALLCVLADTRSVTLLPIYSPSPSMDRGQRDNFGCGVRNFEHLPVTTPPWVTMPKVVFLDTMIYLHFKPVGDIDWMKLLGTDGVRIVVPRITIAELDKHKDSHSNSKVKDRARRILQLLEKIGAGTRAVLRKGVEIERFRNLPSFELAEYELDPTRNDDVMIAAALEFRSQNPDAQIVFVSDDASARITATDVGLTAMSLPDELRLPREVDPVEAENRELKQQLVRLQNAMPKLSLGFRDAESSNRLLIQLETPPGFPEAAIRQHLEKQASEHPPYKQKQLDRSLMSIAALLEQFPDDGEIERYMADRQKYLKAYEDYLRELWRAECERLLTFRVALDLVNVGTAVGADVDVYVHFPDGFELLEASETESQEYSGPKPPPPPRSPRTAMQMRADQFAAIAGIASYPTGWDPSHLPSFRPLGPPPNVSRPNIQETGSYDVRWKVRQVKHRRAEQLDVLVGIFDSYETASSFQITYRLHAANLPDEVEDQLHVVVQKPGG